LTPQTVIEAVTKAGGRLTVRDSQIHYRLPQGHPEKARILVELRNNKTEIIRLLSTSLQGSGEATEMPPGVRLIDWNLKQPPVGIETCSIVTDPGLFARRTLEQLRLSLENPKRWMGWTIPQLIDRLKQVA
jgi:hypothetical protein